MESVKNAKFLYSFSEEDIKKIKGIENSVNPNKFIEKLKDVIIKINKLYQDIFEKYENDKNTEHMLLKFLFFIFSSNIFMGYFEFTSVCLEHFNDFCKIQLLKILNSEDIKKINYNKIFLGLLILYHKNSKLNRTFLYFFEKINIKIIYHDYLNIISEILDSEIDFFCKYLENNYKELNFLYFQNINVVNSINSYDIIFDLNICRNLITLKKLNFPDKVFESIILFSI